MRAALPYRRCAGIVLMRDQCVFAGQRIDSNLDAWQMPQGGIDLGESPKEAALRELEEETGVRADAVTILAESRECTSYDLPEELIGKLWGGQYRGQEQKWFLMRLDVGDEAINIETTHPEFLRWKWMTPDEVIAHIVPFKRATYRQVFKEFGAFFG